MVLGRGSDPRADIFVIFGIEFSSFGRNVDHTRHAILRRYNSLYHGIQPLKPLPPYPPRLLAQNVYRC